jgi:site-specific DNA-methyltransferase (adenine-specific)
MGMPDTARISEGNSAYEGWGTALKPAHEPIVVARKPLSEKTVALNILKWGTAGINIDACRIKTKEHLGRPQSKNSAINPFTKNLKSNVYNNNSTQGRFPSNIIYYERSKGCDDLEKRKIKHGLHDKSYIGDKEYKTNTVSSNNHPTVKPIKLMQYLVRLVTPQGGLCLDPFIGSGTTAIACKLEGINYLGIERESEYIRIAEARIKAYQFQTKLI